MFFKLENIIESSIDFLMKKREDTTKDESIAINPPL